MPHLLNFLKGNGTLLTNDHTILISHTAGGILSSLTGLYPDRNGQTVSNSYDYFQNERHAGSSPRRSSTGPTRSTAPTDPLPNMVGDGGQTTPAPWLTYTHAGCNVGGVSTANIELENNSTTASGDMTRVFGAGSDEWNEAANPATRTKSLADFVGIAIHCAQGNALCDEQPEREARRLRRSIPGSDNGYKALFGAKYVNPAITGGQPCVKATDGTDITDPAGNCGFPGFDGALAKNTLGEVAQMQENGVPVTFAYISDAHDNHTLRPRFGPGRGRLQAAAGRLRHGVRDVLPAPRAATASTRATRSSSSRSTRAITSPAASAPRSRTARSPTRTRRARRPLADVPGEPDRRDHDEPEGARSRRASPSFDLHFDDAPTIYVNGQPAPERSRRCASSSGTLGAATAFDPYVNGAAVPIAQRLADTVEEQTLHMVNTDPKRTPTFTMFGNPDFFFQASNPTTCGADAADCVDPKFAWNHGDFQDEIGNTWLGMVGPGVAQQRRRLDDLDGSHRHPADDQRAARAVRLVPGRRPCDHAGPRQAATRDTAAQRSATRRPTRSSATSTSS